MLPPIMISLMILTQHAYSTFKSFLTTEHISSPIFSSSSIHSHSSPPSSVFRQSLLSTVMSSVNPAGTVALVMLGASAAIAMAYAMARFCSSDDILFSNPMPKPPDEQKEYMHDVRVRNKEMLYVDARAGRSNGKAKQSGNSAV